MGSQQVRLTTDLPHRRVLKQFLEEAGGWRQHGAMESCYTVSVAPDAPVAVAMWHDRLSFYPVQCVATPPPDIVNMMFGAVVRVRDEASDTTKDLNVDQSIAALEEACKVNKTRGTNAIEFMRVVRRLAVSMAQVSPRIYPQMRCCPNSDLMLRVVYGFSSRPCVLHLCMQTLPLIRKFWPGHFIFHAHPVLLLPRHHPDRQRLEAWFSFQERVCADASYFYETQAQSTGERIMDPYRADAELLRIGAQMGVLWDIDGKAVREDGNPWLCSAMRQVLLSVLARCLERAR